MKKFKIGFFGGDSHAGTINDMFQDSLPHNPSVEKVDFEWTSNRLGKPVLDSVGKQYILDNLQNYDLIFQNAWELNEKDNPGLIERFEALNLWKKIVLYDIADEPGFHFERYRDKCLLYLKRAWDPIQLDALDKGSYSVDGRKISKDNLIPLDFPLFRWYLEVVPMDFYPNRDISVLCTLPQLRVDVPRGIVARTVKETDWEPVDGWISQIALFYSSGWVLSSAATSYRDELNPPPPHINWWYEYIHMLRRAKVLFGAGNHTAYGDHRTWESFGSGALYVTDRIPVANPHNPEPWKHYIPFNCSNPQETIKVVKELLIDHTERQRIAKAGLEHAIQYHSSDARVKYVMEEVEKRYKEE